MKELPGDSEGSSMELTVRIKTKIVQIYSPNALQIETYIELSASEARELYKQLGELFKPPMMVLGTTGPPSAYVSTSVPALLCKDSE